MIKLENIHVSYESRDILCGISVRIYKGLTYLIGLNGSGKTSLLHVLAGLLPYKGIVSWQGTSLDTFTPRTRAQQIALVHQHINLPFQLKVYDFVLLGRFPYLNWLGDFRKKDHLAAEAAIKQMELQSLQNRHMNEISGGEFQRACLARAICQDTPILLLDEPAQSLDPRAKKHLYHILSKLAASGRWVVCATHDLEPLEKPDARVIGLAQGKIVWDQTGKQALEQMKRTVYEMETDEPAH